MTEENKFPSDELVEALLQFSEENRKKVAEHLVKEAKKVPQCNQCGEVFEKKRWGITDVTVHWGYESMGKDTDVDKWLLCEDCTKDFEAKFDPICSICKTSVVEVMAALSEQRPGCSFYGDLKAALDHYRNRSHHCGLEYVTVNGRTLCEVCYEDLICSFKIPVPQRRYTIGTGDVYDEEGSVSSNRIQAAKEFRLTEDSLSRFYEHYLPIEEAREARSSSDSKYRVYHIRHSDCKPEYKNKLGRDSYVTMSQGTGDYLRVPLEWLEDLAEMSKVNLDLKDLEVLQCGKQVRLGELILDTIKIAERWDGYIPDECRPVGWKKDEQEK